MTMNVQAFRLMMIGLLAVLITGLTSTSALAQTKEELQASFKKRYPKMVELKKAAKVGETWKGLLDAIDKKFLEEAEVKSLVDAENIDRKKLYALIAEETGTTPDKVAERNAIRNFENARKQKPPYEFLKIKDAQNKEGRWIKAEEWRP
jgi:uncharacterized protein